MNIFFDNPISYKMIVHLHMFSMSMENRIDKQTSDTQIITLKHRQKSKSNL
jgi:hypothetical protein